MDDNQLDKTLKALTDSLGKLGGELAQNRDPESPIWNASHIGNIPVDTKNKKDGWGFLVNKGKLELFPVGENKFYDHNELTNYKKSEHTDIKEIETKIDSTIKEAQKKTNITLNKLVKQTRVDLERRIETLDGKQKKEAQALLKRLKKVEDDISIISNSVTLISELHKDKTDIDEIRGYVNTLEKQFSGMVDLKLGKVRGVIYTKGEVNQKLKQLSERITKTKEVIKQVPTEKARKEVDLKPTLSAIKDLQLNKADHGHMHMAKEIKYKGQRLNEYLDTLSVGDGLPDQTGNSGKFLTTDGTDASWATLAGGGDMAAATYDPQAIAGDAFNTDNHTDGTTNKVFTAIEKTKLSGIAESANNYSLPTAAAGTLGGVKVGTRLTITDGVLSADSQTDNNFTTTLKNKLDGIEAGAEANVVDSVNGQTGVVSLDIDDIAPTQTGNSGKVLKTDGTNVTWQDDATGAGGVDDGDKGDITVSGSGATWTIDNDAVTYAKIQNVSATDRLLGRGTAGAGVIEEIAPSAVRTMLNVEDGANNYTHPNHSGDVTSVADGATTIADGAVTLAKMANLAANTIIGRVTASTGVPEALTAANVRTIINVEDGADVTDTTNVTAAGALMDSEVDADLKTLSLPANTTISTYAASFLDDANEATFKATVNLEIGTDVQAYDANNATASSTTTFTNKTIDANGTGNSISNLEVADFTATAIVTATDTIASNNNDTTIPTSAAVKAYADSVGGGAVPGTLVVFKPAENEPPSTNFATIDTRNSHPVLDFDSATNESAVFSGIMPSYYGGGGVTVYIHYAMTSATSGDIDWDVAFERIGDQQLDIDADSFAAVNSVDNTTVPGTSGNVDVVSIAFTDGADMDSVAAGEGFRLKITRDAASDTAAGDAELLYLEIRETAA